MQNAGIDEVTAKATNNAEEMYILESRPIPREEKETCEQAKDEEIDLTPQQKFSNECLEVYDVIFGLIQWRFETLREVCDDFNCVTSEALAVRPINL